MTSSSQSDQYTPSHYAGKKVLITGAAGFIGRHVAARLNQLGAIVEVTARESQGFKRDQPALQNIEVTALDVSDLEAVKKTITGKNFDLVVHLAARAAGDRGKDQMIEQSRVTLGGTVNLATALLDSPGTLLLHIGSSEEYGAANVPFYENQALSPVSPYSAAKAAASHFLLMARESFGLPVIIARPSVVFGPGQKTGMVIPYLFDCYQKKQPASISPGEQTRDFVYIDDCVEGLLRLGLRADLSGECFNLGSGQEVKLKRVAFDIAKLTGYEGDLGLGSRPYRSPEVMEHKESVVKALDKIGWSAQISLQEGLQRTYEWWLAQPGAS